MVGCASAPERTLSKKVPPYATLPNGADPLNPSRLPDQSVATVNISEGVISALETLRGHALNILELSGGGQYGAFGAGFLKGWTESGARPVFDIVTGVSAGSLLATHAFLGTPADDAVLQEIFTGASTADIYTSKGPLKLLFGENSLFDTAPLQALLDKHITPEVMQRVAAAYGQHRRLLIGTTNLDYSQTWVWNMGEIAKQGTPESLELFKKVLLASSSPPIAFPPVLIDGHLFADGGVRQNLVVIGLAGTTKPKPPKYGPGTVFVVHNGKEIETPSAVRNDAIHMAGPVLGAMMNTSTDSMLLRAYSAAKLRGYRFRLVAIPDEAEVGNNALAFDTGQMRASFGAGLELGRMSDPWKSVPPVMKDLPSWIFVD